MSNLKRIKLYEPAGELTPSLVRDVLGLVDTVTPPLELLAAITTMELGILYDWAIREHLHASDNVLVRRRERPYLIHALNLQAQRTAASDLP